MKIFLAIIALVIILVFVFKKDHAVAPVVVEDSAVGCYVATLGQDVYSLNIATENGEAVTGTLVFKNFQKDSSAGTFVGTYKDGILLGDYSFQSEGMYSVMQVIFKKTGDDFVRGFGPVDETGTRFTDLTGITYDNSQIFKPTDAACATSLQ